MTTEQFCAPLSEEFTGTGSHSCELSGFHLTVLRVVLQCFCSWLLAYLVQSSRESLRTSDLPTFRLRLPTSDLPTYRSLPYFHRTYLVWLSQRKFAENSWDQSHQAAAAMHHNPRGNRRRRMSAAAGLEGHGPMVPADQLEGAGQVQGHDHGDNLPLSLSVAVLLKELAVQQANLVLPTRAFETSLARTYAWTPFFAGWF
jgi:hypothetical protein